MFFLLGVPSPIEKKVAQAIGENPPLGGGPPCGGGFFRFHAWVPVLLGYHRPRRTTAQGQVFSGPKNDASSTPS